MINLRALGIGLLFFCHSAGATPPTTEEEPTRRASVFTMPAGSEQGTVNGRRSGSSSGLTLEGPRKEGYRTFPGSFSAQQHAPDGRTPNTDRRESFLRIRDLKDIKLDFDNGVSVGMQSYRSSFDKKRYDLGMRRKIGDLDLGFTVTRPGVQMRAKMGDIKLDLRLSGASDDEATFLLRLKKEW